MVVEHYHQLATLKLAPCHLSAMPGRLDDCAALMTLDLSHCSSGLAALLERPGDCVALITLSLSY